MTAPTTHEALHPNSRGMLASPLEAALFLSFCLLFVFGIESRRRAARKLPLPPGPPPLPLLGNILDVPKSICAEEYNALNVKYGKTVPRRSVRGATDLVHRGYSAPERPRSTYDHPWLVRGCVGTVG